MWAWMSRHALAEGAACQRHKEGAHVSLPGASQPARWLHSGHSLMCGNFWRYASMNDGLSASFLAVAVSALYTAGGARAGGKRRGRACGGATWKSREGGNPSTGSPTGGSSGTGPEKCARSAEPLGLHCGLVTSRLHSDCLRTRMVQRCRRHLQLSAQVGCAAHIPAGRAGPGGGALQHSGMHRKASQQASRRGRCLLLQQQSAGPPPPRHQTTAAASPAAPLTAPAPPEGRSARCGAAPPAWHRQHPAGGAGHRPRRRPVQRWAGPPPPCREGGQGGLPHGGQKTACRATAVPCASTWRRCRIAGLAAPRSRPGRFPSRKPCATSSQAQR